MSKKFAVSAKRRAAKVSSTLFLLAGVAAAAAVAFAFKYTEDQTVLALSVAGSLMLLISGFRIMNSKDEDVEVSLAVNQLAVQLSTHRNGKPVGRPVLIPRNTVLDVIVNEVVLSHKVMTVVILRLLKAVESNGTNRQITSLLQDGNVRLEVAFPGVELSYMECIRMRREISRALGLLES